MSEVSKPTNEEMELAIEAALTRPNPIDQAHAKAYAAERFLNDFYEEFEDEDDQEALDELLEDTIEELTDECGHMDAEILVTGLVKVRKLDHKLADANGGDIPRDAKIETWKPIEEQSARSLGYIALRDDHNGTPYSIYHIAQTDRTRIAFSPEFGEIFESGRLLIPVDGTARAEFASGFAVINYPLMEKYSGKLLKRIDAIIANAESLTDSIQRLGKLDLSKYPEVAVDEDIRFSIINHVNYELDIQSNLLYEISGGHNVERHDVDKERDVADRLYRNSSIVGKILGLDINERTNKFVLAAAVPFDDNSVQKMTYKINPKLAVRQLPTFSVSSSTRLQIK